MTTPMDPGTVNQEVLGSEEGEAYQALLHIAHGRTGHIPEPLLIRHVLSVTEGGDWPVQRGALEALLRRWKFARRDELRISATPGGRRHLGRYEIKRRRAATRPYASLLTSVDPPAGSCSCPDFSRSSLGLCKHLLVILDYTWTKAGRARRAQAEQQREAAALDWRLEWDPVRPLVGPGDWLARVSWVEGSERRPGRRNQMLEAARGWFQEPGADGIRLLADAHEGDPNRRLQLAADLLRLVKQEDRRCRRSPLATNRIDPALPPLLARESGLLDQGLEGVEVTGRLRASLGTMKQRLYPYQVEGLRRFLDQGRLLLADDMGLGKTIQAVAACHVLWSEGLVQRGLVVVPASLKSQWEQEWQTFSDIPVEVVDGDPARRAATYRRCRRGFLIVNYEQILRDLFHIHRWKPCMVVLDEAQRIKNWATKTATYVKQLQPRYRLVLTGTPMENRIEELASIMDWVDNLALEPKWRLRPWHAMAGDGSQEVSGARNLNTLRERLSPAMTRRVRQEVLDQLPPRTDTQIPVELTETQRAEHVALHQPIAVLMNRARKRPLTQAEFFRLMSLLTTQRIICNGMAQYQFEEVWPSLEAAGRPSEAMLRGLCSPKLLELRELVAHIAVGQRRKMVIFSGWRRMLKLAHWAVSDLLAEAHVRAAFFTGQESQQRRTQNIVDFHDDPATLLLFASDAGGVGLNLQRAASCTVHLELPWNPAVLEQRIGRIYRIGQTRPIQVYYLVSEGGIEARIANLVRDKRALFTGLFDGSSDEVQFESSGSFLDRIEKLVDPIQVPDLEQPEDDDEAALLEPTMEPPGPPSLKTPVEPAPESGQPAEVTAAGRRRPEQPSSGAAPAAVTGEQVTQLLGRIQVSQSPDGGITIQAAPEAAATLAAMFDGMARMLATAAPPGDGRS